MTRLPLRVFYNASALPLKPAGAGVYTLELGRALAARPHLRLSVASPRPLGFGDALPTPRKLLPRLFWEQMTLAREQTLAEADVYHGPHFFVPRTSVPTVATVHDLTFFRLPRRYDAAHRAYYRHLARQARRADRIIVPSSGVAAECVHYLGYSPERIRVIPEAPRSELAPASEEVISAVRQRYGLAGPYLLCLGTAEPGKRAVDAVRALPAVLAARPDVTLVLAGAPGPLSAALTREAERLGVSAAVRSIGYAPNGELPGLLTGATALVFPSLAEGFGLPPLEAMVCGTPVISSDAPAMREVLTGGAIFVPMRAPAAIASAALALLNSELRSQLAGDALACAARYSWKKAAEATEAVYRELMP